jgi:hypothetical protein
VSRWCNGERSGVVRGVWRAANNKRCVTIESGLSERANSEQCEPVFRLAQRYLSTNAAGDVHGVHQLTPLSDEELARLQQNL